MRGVTGWDKHLGLDVLPEERVRSWFRCLNDYEYTGVLNLEVFDPVDLEKSLQVLEKMKNMEPGECTLYN